MSIRLTALSSDVKSSVMAPSRHSLFSLPASLFKRKAQSNSQRYEQLVRLYHADIYRYAFWLCRDQHIAEDIVQDTFLRAWKALDSLLDDNAAKSWLITILRRENARRFERKQLDYSDVEQELLTDDINPGLEQQYDNALLQQQLLLLPPEYSEPLLLQALAGFNSEEIGQLLSLNVNTVNTRLFRARHLLKQRLLSQQKAQQNVQQSAQQNTQQKG
ncbi:sigma-70 family RNA polymerase sigma factor [Arsukibacterium indicum]|uniref:RNA polymerase sigma factor n=1 Tax=Arsukibacterium indicum TaxID=2848612 RepID=A0ABS6MML4_9GAMM|nr:sigma-70 family RNA polymerase sigma factor [Arsukibacterium indicum]MBV2129566.1 sigma-70 family RNA polymerase sigma factor [Arsukibacterium indicum]